MAGGGADPDWGVTAGVSLRLLLGTGCCHGQARAGGQCVALGSVVAPRSLEQEAHVHPCWHDLAPPAVTDVPCW